MRMKFFLFFKLKVMMCVLYLPFENCANATKSYKNILNFWFIEISTFCCHNCLTHSSHSDAYFFNLFYCNQLPALLKTVKQVINILWCIFSNSYDNSLSSPSHKSSMKLESGDSEGHTIYWSSFCFYFKSFLHNLNVFLG